jgi:predicted dehydrogenase
MRFAVIGLAGAGRQHIHQVLTIEGLELAAVCDVDAGILAAAEVPESVARFASTEKMLDQVALDAVTLCTPPASHLPLTRLAAARGCSVLCEKPMATTLEQCDGMIAACAEAGVALMIAHKKRFFPAVQKLKALTEEIGPLHFGLHRYPHPWLSPRDWFWAEEDGGGPLLENAVHAADLIRYVFGDVERVYAEASPALARRETEQLNAAAYTARFTSGAIVGVGAGMVSAPALSFEDFFVAGDRGVAEMSGSFDGLSTVKWALRTDAEATTLVQEGDPFRLEFEHFAECCRTGREPLTSGSEGKKAVAVCLAVKESARTGRPVTLA